MNNKQKGLAAFGLASVLALTGAIGGLRAIERNTLTNLYQEAAEIRSDKQRGFNDVATDNYNSATALINNYLRTGDYAFISSNELVKAQRTLDYAINTKPTNTFDTLGPEMRALLNKGSHK
ncbi:MAG: hypothetical protein WCK29_01060 [archaeon]